MGDSDKGKAKVTLGRFSKDFDRNLAILGAILALILSIYIAINVEQLLWAVISFIGFASCVGYLIIRRSSYSQRLPLLSELRLNRSFYLILNILFFALLSYSMVSVALRPELYSRPLGYFISTALMAAIVAIEILVLPRRRSYTYLILLKIIIIALSLRLVVQYIFPGFVWFDPWWHESIVQQTLGTGQIVEGTDYSRIPVMHLLIASTMLITNLAYKASTILSVGLAQVIANAVFIFLVADKILHNPRLGLLAALLLGVADTVIERGIVAYPMTLGLMWIIIIIYTQFRAYQTPSITNMSISLLFMAVLILTHPLAAAFMAVIFLCFWLGFHVYKSLYPSRLQVTPSVTILILFVVAMLSWWMYASGHIFDFAKALQWAFAADYFVGPLEVVQYRQAIPLSEYLLDRMGFFLFFAISFIGVLYFFSKKAESREGFSLAIAGLVILAVAFLSIPLGLRTYPQRWLPCSQTILAIPAALGFLLICNTFRSSLAKVSVLTILILVTSFSMMTDIAANFDQPVFSTRVVRLAYTESEIESMETISGTWDGVIATDLHAHAYFSHSKRMDTEILSDGLLEKDFSEFSDTMVVIRKYVTEKPFLVSGGTCELDYNPRDVLDNQGFSRVYESGSVSAFMK